MSTVVVLGLKLVSLTLDTCASRRRRGGRGGGSKECTTCVDMHGCSCGGSLAASDQARAWGGGGAPRAGAPALMCRRPSFARAGTHRGVGTALAPQTAPPHVSSPSCGDLFQPPYTLPGEGGRSPPRMAGRHVPRAPAAKKLPKPPAAREPASGLPAPLAHEKTSPGSAAAVRASANARIHTPARAHLVGGAPARRLPGGAIPARRGGPASRILAQCEAGGVKHGWDEAPALRAAPARVLAGPSPGMHEVGCPPAPACRVVPASLDSGGVRGRGRGERHRPVLGRRCWRGVHPHLQHLVVLGGTWCKERNREYPPHSGQADCSSPLEAASKGRGGWALVRGRARRW